MRCGLLGIFLLGLIACDAKPAPLDYIHLPQGFSIHTYAHVRGARQMALGDDGIVYVGSADADSVFALIPNKDKTAAQEIKTIAKDLNQSAGVAYYKGSLYIGETHRITRIKNITQHLNNVPPLEIINDTFPNESHHGYKHIGFSPDGWLYVPVGAPCNVCLEDDPRFGTITRMRPDGSQLEIYAQGVRNSVGIDWHPVTKELWFTDNGRDWLGDNLPPCELNRAPKKGLHFGFPFIHGKDIIDPDYGDRGTPKNFTPPAQALGPHVAPLGMTFYTGKMFPKQYRHQIFIAEHGSWNRSKKIGYRVTMVTLKGNKAVSYEPFAYGWLQPHEKVRGRPVDVLVMPDGSLLVSDDYADVIYRISYKA